MPQRKKVVLRFSSLVLAAWAAVAITAPLGAAGVDLAPGGMDNLPAANLVVKDGAAQLPLDLAIEIALARNLGLVVERYNWVQAQESLIRSRSVYDPILASTLGFSDSTSPSAQRVEGVPVTTSKGARFTLGLDMLVPTGGTVSFDLNGTRSDSNSRNQFLNPQFQGGNSVSFFQPLLRGFGRLPTERNILVAKISQNRQRELFTQQVLSVVDQVEQSYWNLVEARNQLEVAKEALRLAQVLHDQNKIRVEVGTLAPLELVQSEAGIANREEGIIRAEAAIGDAEDTLRRLLNLDQGELWGMPIVPTTDAAVTTEPVDLKGALEAAARNRPELNAQRLRQETLEIDRKVAVNGLLPQLNARVTYGVSGLSGKTSADTPAADRLDGNFGDVIEQWTDFDFDNWGVELSFSYPIFNSERRSQLASADFEILRGRVEMADLEQRIITEVRTAARRVDTAAKQIQSAKISRQLEEKNLEAERKRYENGMSSSFQVLQIQDDLTQARSREVIAVTAYRRAVAELLRSTGELLKVKGVELVGAE